jgi:hypothetical protein
MLIEWLCIFHCPSAICLPPTLSSMHSSWSSQEMHSTGHNLLTTWMLDVREVLPTKDRTEELMSYVT